MSKIVNKAVSDIKNALLSCRHSLLRCLQTERTAITQ